MKTITSILVSAGVSMMSLRGGEIRAQSADSLTNSPARYRNAVRFDVGGVVAGTVASTALGGSALFPLLVSYERQIHPRFSVGAEVLANGGSAYERKAGGSVQSRYYFRPKRTGNLAGFYVTPVLAYRRVRLTGYYEPEVKRHFVGTGALVGWQSAGRRNSRWLWDVAAGLMSWQQAGADQVTASPFGSSRVSGKAYYETHPTDFDGRLGIGYRF